MCEDIDVELFIEKIKSYPELWNTSAEDFHDRKKKRNAWFEVCKEFCEGFEDLEDKQKNATCYTYIKKWRNIRDNYMRNIRKKIRTGRAADSGRLYVYARQLSFLNQSGATTETQSSISEDEQSIQPEDETENPVAHLECALNEHIPPLSCDRNARKRRKDDLQSLLINLMNTPVPSPTAPKLLDINPDMSFFESLLPALNEFTEDQKLDFRFEVLNLLRKMRRQNST